MYKFGQTSAEIFDLHWSGPPVPEFAGVQSKEPIYVVASATTPEITVDFYAANSNSFPFGSKDGWWENLIPTWKFCDENGNAVESVTIHGTSAEWPSGSPLSGNVFYEYRHPVWYVDQMASSPKRPIHLWAVMNLSAMGIEGEWDYPGHANSNICDVTVARVSSMFPDSIRYTIDGITPLSAEYHWTDTVVPFIGTARSSYFDSVYVNSDKISIGNGIVYGYPISESARLPFYATTRTSMSALSAETGEYKTVLGKTVYDEEGMPVEDVETTGYYYHRAPVSAYDPGLGIAATAYGETSSRENLYIVPSATQYAIPGTEIEYTAPAFNRYDNRSGDNYYVGGYFIGNAVMPDTARTSGEQFHGSSPMDPAASAYIAPHAAWVSAPSMGAMYRVFPMGTLSDDEIRELERRGYPVPRDHWTMAPVTSSSIAAENIMMADPAILTPSHYEMLLSGLPDAYYLSGVHGIYCTAVDLNYNLWGVDEERGHLYKISPNGELAMDIDLNGQLWDLSGSNQTVRDYFGTSSVENGRIVWKMDIAEKCLQPSWICLSQKKDMDIYIGYHASYLVTKHDMSGNMLDADFSNPVAYAGSLAQRKAQMASKGFPAMADNANKPCFLSFGENDDVWATYSSTSVGYAPASEDDGARIQYQDQSRICLYTSGLVRHADQSMCMRMDDGTNIVDLCVFRGDAYILTMDTEDRGELVRIYKAGPTLGIETLVDKSAGVTRPGHLSISNDGKCWFHGGVRDIYCRDTATGRLYAFLRENVSLYPLDDKLYAKDPFVQIEGMEIDSEGYLWIVDNMAARNIQRIDTDAMIDWAVGRSDLPATSAESTNAADRPFPMPGLPSRGGRKSRNLYPKGVFTGNGIGWRQEWSVPGNTGDVPFVIANGDWTGIKIETGINQIIPSSLSADSGLIYLQDHKHFNFRKYSESWDLVDNMKKNILVPKFRDSSKTFWDEYAETMVGGVDNTTYPIGRRLFERIANLVPNLHDVEDSTLMGLQSMALAQDVPMDEYDVHFPEAMSRMVDLFSCRHKRVWGDRCTCDTNYTEMLRNSKNKTCFCTSCGHWHVSNCGDKFDIGEQDLTKDRTPYLVRNPMESKSQFKKIVPTEKSVEDAKLVLYKILTRQWVYDDSYRFAAIPNDFAESILISTDYNTQLMAVHTQFFIDEAWYNMCYWHFNPTRCGVQNVGLVHWDDEYTTFPETLSGSEEFYDNPDPAKDRATGYAAMTFQWLLYKGLGFALSGTST